MLKFAISSHKRLYKATIAQLENYEVSRTGAHWSDLDEDLSLRGFLKHELAFLDRPEIE